MGLAASLFYSSNSDNQTLFRRVTPSDKQFDEQQERWNNLAEFLLDDLTDKTDLTSRSWLQGSYKFGTQVRPAKPGDEFDIDLGVYVEWPGADASGPLGARELKNHVQSGLNDYAEDDDDVIEVTAPKPRCCRIRFKGSFHIDVPSYHLDPNEDRRSLATQGDEWEDSDPKAIYVWFKDRFSDYDRAKVRRHICYFKMWAALKCSDDSRPSSIMLTVLIADAYASTHDDDRASDDDCFAAIAHYVYETLQSEPAVPNPANMQEDLNRLSDTGFTLLLARLSDLVGIADAALAAETKAEAAEHWSDAFDQFFPGVDDDELTESVSKALVPIAFDPQIAVVARTKGLHPREFSAMNQIGPIPKDCDITFRLMNAGQLPRGAEVRWTVRNEGEEAERANDLGHAKSLTGLTAEEHSAYKGRHFMDVAVFAHGRLIGRRRVPVTILGLSMPPRNLPRKRQF